MESLKKKVTKLYGLILPLDELLKTSAHSFFIEKGSHTFKKSFGLKESLSFIERQSTVLDLLLVQVKVIVIYYYFNIYTCIDILFLVK